jgi:hypothetical protein
VNAITPSRSWRPPEDSIHGPRAGSGDYQKYKREQHGNVRSGIMGSSPETFVQKHGDFRSRDGDTDVDQQWDRRQADEKTGDHADAEHTLDHAHEWRSDCRRRNPDLNESADAQGFRE